MHDEPSRSIELSHGAEASRAGSVCGTKIAREGPPVETCDAFQLLDGAAMNWIGGDLRAYALQCLQGQSTRIFALVGRQQSERICDFRDEGSVIDVLKIVIDIPGA